MTRAASEAEQLLEDLGLTEVPVIPDEVCKAMSTSSYQISLTEEPMVTNNFHGISLGDTNGAQILVNANITNRHRRRFTAAHEIGHVHLHIQTNIQSQFQCTSKDISAGEHSNNIYETEANVFASSLLMPSSAVSSIVNRNDLSWPLVHRIAALCDVSFEAAARRTIALSNDACCLIIHKQNTMWSPIKSRKFSTYVPAQPFPTYLIKQPDIGSAESLTNNIEECDFSDWAFPDGASGKLLYTSIHNEEFNRTMTFLIHEEDIEENDYDEAYEPHF